MLTTCVYSNRCTSKALHAATAEANTRITKLQGEVAELKTQVVSLQAMLLKMEGKFDWRISELKEEMANLRNKAY